MGGGNGTDNGNGARPREVPGAITTVHRYELPLGPKTVWSLINGVDQYRSWWPWLRQFEGGGLSVGDEWHCTVQPPVPYLVRFRVVIDHVEPPSLVQAQVAGDVVGDATLTLETETADGDGTDGCVAVLHSSLAPGNTALAIVSRFAAPIARFGHDWVLDGAAKQFIARAIEPALGDPAP